MRKIYLLVVFLGFVSAAQTYSEITNPSSLKLYAKLNISFSQLKSTNHSDDDVYSQGVSIRFSKIKPQCLNTNYLKIFGEILTSSLSREIRINPGMNSQSRTAIKKTINEK